jgi:hypothetical protein
MKNNTIVFKTAKYYSGQGAVIFLADPIAATIKQL